MENKSIVMDSATVVEKNRKQGMRIESGLFSDSVASQSLGTPVDNSKYSDAAIIDAGAGKWENSAKYDELWRNIYRIRARIEANYDRNTHVVKNASQFPADYYDLINYLRLDMTRRRADYADYTAMITAETVRPDASKKIGLQEFKPYTGVFEEIVGNGDAVSMIEHATGDERVKLVHLYGLGDVRTLEDELYNLDIWSMQKVNDAFARSFIAKRNDLCLGQIVLAGRVWQALQHMDDVTTSTLTYDERLYQTVLGAYRKLRALKDPQTGQEIDASRCTLITNYADAWDIERVIRGQLDQYKGKPVNLSSLSFINEIIPYRGDIITANKKTVTYAGVAAKKAYICVTGPNNAPAYTMTKRGLTYEVGRGDVLTLAREARVGYFGQANYLDEFFGGSADTPGTAGTGYIVEMDLPAA
jgi:hypothetical protein